MGRSEESDVGGERGTCKEGEVCGIVLYVRVERKESARDRRNQAWKERKRERASKAAKEEASKVCLAVNPSKSLSRELDYNLSLSLVVMILSLSHANIYVTLIPSYIISSLLEI